MALVPVHDTSTLTNYDINLTRFEKIEHQRKLIHEWKPASEVWWLKYGAGVFGAFVIGSGTIINKMFRNKLKLRNVGRVWTGLAIALGPGAVGGFTFNEIITNRILLLQYKCPLCIELKAISIITLSGLLYPLLLSPVMNLTVAAHLGLRIPHFLEVVKLSKFWWSVVQPSAPTLGILCTVNSIGAGIITYKQILSIETITDVLLRITKHESENAGLVTFD